MFNRIDRVMTFLPLDEGDATADRAGGDFSCSTSGKAFATPRIGGRFGGFAAGRDRAAGLRPAARRAADQAGYRAARCWPPLATRLNEYSAEAPLVAGVEAEGDATWGFPSAGGERNESARRDPAARQDLAQLATDTVLLRRSAAETSGSRPVTELRNEVFRLERTRRTPLEARNSSARPAAIENWAQRLESLRKLVQRTDAMVDGAG